MYKAQTKITPSRSCGFHIEYSVSIRLEVVDSSATHSISQVESVFLAYTIPPSHFIDPAELHVSIFILTSMQPFVFF